MHGAISTKQVPIGATVCHGTSLDYEIGFYAKNDPKFLEERKFAKLAEVEEPSMSPDSIGRERVMAKPRSKDLQEI